MFFQVIQGTTSQPQALIDALKAFRTSGTARSRSSGRSRAPSKVKESDPC